MLILVVVHRLERGQRVAGGKILYVNKRRQGRSSSKNSRLKRVHLLFDEDGNALDANAEGSTVTERVKSFLEAVEKDSADQAMSDEPLFSDVAVVDDSKAVCSSEEQTVCSNSDSSNAVLVNSAECCLSLTVSVTLEGSACQDETEETALESEICYDEVSQFSADNAAVVNSDCTVTSVVASNDPDISKYWWQRYRLFSRFDRGIMIDRGR